MMKLKFNGVWQDAKTAMEPTTIQLDSDGKIENLWSWNGESVDREFDGILVPDLVNTHSHAFQFQMAGETEHLPESARGDNFWSWRESMYDYALSMTPELLCKVATNLYQRLKLRGFHHVVEFHYVHHDSNGKPYSDQALMGASLCEAASKAKIGLTLVPIFYEQCSFDVPATQKQRRFLSQSTEAYLKLFEASKKHTDYYGFQIGLGIHSIRAAKKESIEKLFSHVKDEMPVHLHISEQKKEIEDCEKFYGKTPVEWLFDTFELPKNLHLVHATHLTRKEVSFLANAKNVSIALCPSTEGNLGDGIFPLTEFIQAGGQFSIGTDSHIGLDAMEELRWLEYQQRLTRFERNPLCKEGEESGDLLFSQALRNGRRASGLPFSGHAFEKGQSLHGRIVKNVKPNDPHLISKLVFTHALDLEPLPGG